MFKNRPTLKGIGDMGDAKIKASTAPAKPSHSPLAVQARKVITLLADLNRQFNRTVIIATHSSLADADATLKMTLRDGRLVA